MFDWFWKYHRPRQSATSWKMSTCIISRNCSKNRRRDVRYILVTLNILRCINEYFLFNNFYIFTVQKRKIERLEHLLLIKFHMESLNWFSSAVEEICFWYIHAIGIKSTLTRYRPPSDPLHLPVLCFFLLGIDIMRFFSTIRCFRASTQCIHRAFSPLHIPGIPLHIHTNTYTTYSWAIT